MEVGAGEPVEEGAEVVGEGVPVAVGEVAFGAGEPVEEGEVVVGAGVSVEAGAAVGTVSHEGRASGTSGHCTRDQSMRR